MKRKEIIATLIEVSNDLDNIGLVDEADILTKTAQSFGELSPSEPEFNPDNDATEQGFLGQDDYDREREIMDALRNEDTLMELDARIEELKLKQAPTNEDLEELDKLLDYRMGPSFDPNNVRMPQDELQFVENLKDAGADISEPDLDDPFRGE
jgi:hypothetical protein